MKNIRQNAILEIIAEKKIETQEQLLEELRARGVNSTQATISRDIKDLRLVKEVSPEGTYHYAPASHDENTDAVRRLEEIFRGGCLSFDHALHTVVIKTLPGLAMAVCAAVDAMWDDSILGSVAGDDTCIIVMRNAASAERFCAQLRRVYSR